MGKTPEHMIRPMVTWDVGGGCCGRRGSVGENDYGEVINYRSQLRVIGGSW